MTSSTTVFHQFRPIVFMFAASIMGAVLLSPAQAETETETETETQSYPPHVDIATLGTVLGLRGQEASEQGLPVSLAPDVADHLSDQDFQYEGFLLNTFLINGYATIRDQPNTWHAYGILVFEDLGARRAYTQFSTYYRVQQEGLEIYRASARPMTPARPSFVWFAMREEDISSEMLAPKSHAMLMKLAGTQSLTSVPTDADDYVVIALSMDRFADEQQVQFESTDGALSVKSLNLGGWPVGVFSGPIDPRHFENILSAQVSGGDATFDKITLSAFPIRPFVWE